VNGHLSPAGQQQRTDDSAVQLTVAVRDYPHTRPLLDRTVPVLGCEVEFAEVEPIHRAFAPMVRELRYDVCELAIATLLQAFEAGVPIAALPVVLHGNFHHRSISGWGGEQQLRPEDLRGRRVGVRAYSQTTGLWVRGILSETYGVKAQDVTWVTTEGAHVDSYREPANVERIPGRLVDALRAGEVDAVVMGARSVEHVEGLEPLITDWKQQQEQFLRERGWVPINHLVVVRRDLLQSQPDVVRSVYRALCQSIDAARPATPTGSVRELAIQYGITDSLVNNLQTAIGYAREQQVIRTDLDASALFADFEKYVGVE
jgi:4,5-dihydroxyphthalate decarboxylase